MRKGYLKVLFFSFLAVHCTASADWLKSASDLLGVENPQSIDSLGDLSNEDISAAFKESLQIAADKVVNQLGQNDGFNADKSIHIPLPKELQTVQSVLQQVGLGQVSEDLELKLNRAAELATPKAQALFVESIQSMTFTDIKAIYNGPSDSATTYFKDKMSTSLQKEMQPIVADSLAEVGAIQAYDQAISDYQNIPFVPDVKADLTDYVVDKGMQGIFYYMGKQEAAIRENPVEQTTALLQKVFGNK